MSSNLFSRRSLLRGIAGVAGTAMGARLGGKDWIGSARAGNPAGKSALVCVYLPGGYNSMFSSADSFVGKEWLAMKAEDVVDIGAGSEKFGVHKLIGNLPNAKTNMASVGVGRITACHGRAARQMWSEGNTNYAVKLAAEMGGEASIKAACIGPFAPDAPRGDAQGGVTLQTMTDMASTLQALGASAPNMNEPARDVAAQVLARAHAMSKRDLARNPKSMTNFEGGYSTIVDTYKKPVAKLPSFAEIAAPYEALYSNKSKKISTTIGDLYSKFVGAELMLRSGTNVVVISDGKNEQDLSWDHHYIVDGGGELEHIQGTDYNSFGISFIKAFGIFLDRVFNSPGLSDMNITVALFAEFARSVPDSGHQPNLTATVFGSRVKTGTTGRCDVRNGLSPDTPPPQAFWAYLAALANVGSQPFGSHAFHQKLIA